jgi:hypothetical protein
MSTFINPTENGILEEIKKNRAKHIDYLVSEKGKFSTSIDNGIKFIIPEKAEVYPDTSALSQLLTRNEVTVSFFNKCSNNLKGQILKEFVDGKTYFIRATTSNGCRAVMSTSYNPMDDHQLYPIVLDELAEEDIFNHKFFEQDGHITKLTTAINDENTQLPYYASITTTNSETGHSSVWIEPSVIIKDLNLQLANRTAVRDMISRFIHRGSITEDKIKKAIKAAKKIAQVGVIQLMEAEREVVDPTEVVEFMEAMDFFPKRFSLIVEEEIKDDKQLFRMAAVKKILIQAKELPLIQQIAVEQSAGKFLKLFDNFDKRLKLLEQEVSDGNL